LRSATVLFGESLPAEPWQRSVELATSCDLMLVVGTSLVVNPAARLPVMAQQRGAEVALINRTATPLDDRVSVRLFDEAGPTLSALVERLKQVA
jgi:NAD-dependent deacetylase